MTPAYLTEQEITRELRLPDKLGRIQMEIWKMSPSFPKPVDGTGGRRWFPAVVEWLMSWHGIATAAAQQVAIPLSGNKGEDFNGWRKAKAARRPKRTGPDLPPPPARLDPVVVAAVGPDQTRLQGQDNKVMAFRPRAVPAE